MHQYGERVADDLLAKTPMHAWHVEAGGRMVPFAGFELPVQYAAGLVAEHQAVREAVGMFDVSHMGEFVCEGPDARSFLQYALTNDIERLEPGKAQYTLMCQNDGGLVDDLVVYCDAPDRYLLCVNAARRADDWQHLQGLSEGRDLHWRDLSNDIAQIAVQGPKAFEVLKKLGAPVPDRGFDFVVTSVGRLDGVRIARTGYTGELGVELYLNAADGAQPLATLER